jgi:hypothetical protein
MIWQLLLAGLAIANAHHRELDWRSILIVARLRDC